MVKQIRILHLTTHDEECGIARYQEQFIEGMHTQKDIVNEVFETSPNVSRFMSESEYEGVLANFEKQLKEFDILHIQHELSFYKHKELESVISIARKQKKKVIITIHTALDVEYKKARLKGVGPRSVRRFLRELEDQKKFERSHLNPVKKADLIIVHNSPTRQSLINHGFNKARITKIRMPVPNISLSKKSDEIHKALQYQKGDILFCTVGFISKSKGVDQAIKSLEVLPSNYKLAIIGGMHPRSDDNTFLDEIKEQIHQNRLESRVHITGYVKDDAKMNALIRECDICVYPYDTKYYYFVSSAALSNALANHKATIAYPIQSFKEVNDTEEVIDFCQTSDYKGLAARVRDIDIPKQVELAKKYAETHAYDQEAIKFTNIYRKLMTTD